MVTVCPVEDPGCETDTIVTAEVGACEGCEDVNVKGSASGVSIFFICRVVGNRLPMWARSLRNGTIIVNHEGQTRPPNEKLTSLGVVMRWRLRVHFPSLRLSVRTMPAPEDEKKDESRQHHHGGHS